MPLDGSAIILYYLYVMCGRKDSALDSYYKYYNGNVIISKFKSRNQGMVYRIFIIAHRSFDIYFMY